MSRIQRCALLPALLGLAFLACTGEPIPKRVVAGTTFVVPYQGGVFGVDPSLNSPTFVKPDPVRGNISFALCPDAACSTRKRLSVRYLTRLFPDRGSPFGLTGEAQFVGLNGLQQKIEGQLIGEPVVIADVPLDTQPRSYMLVYFLDPPGPLGEGMPNLIGPIEVVQGGGNTAFTDIARLLNLGDGSLSLTGFVPYPQISVGLVSQVMSKRPAAGTLVLSTPSSVSIEGGFESGVLGQASFVRVVRLADTPTADPTRPKRNYSITFVDPDLRTTALRLPFKLADPNAPAPSLLDSDFVFVKQDLYDLNGSLLPLATLATDPGNAFRFTGIQ